MKDIYWDKLKWYNKIAYVLGWLGVLNIWFWIIIIISYFYKKGEGKLYKPFFNPHTKKIPYIFGWIYLVCIILLLAVMIFLL